MTNYTLSSREIELLVHGLNQAQFNPKVNFATLAVDANYGSSGSAKTSWGNLRKKLRDMAIRGSAPLSPSTPSTPKTPKSGLKRGRPSSQNHDTPSKKNKVFVNSSKKTLVKREDEAGLSFDGHEDDYGSHLDLNGNAY